MPTPPTRHVLHLELVLAEHAPEIVREIAIDENLTLAELARVIPALLGGPRCERHVFVTARDSGRWSNDRRRWGDRWTLIDLRDPTLVDESTARIGRVLRAGEPLVYAHTCDPEFAVNILPGVEDIVAGTAPAVRVVSGERAAPLACTRSAFAHEVLCAVLDDAEHPHSSSLRTSLAAAVGPWAAYDPEWFDLSEAQRAVDAAIEEPRMPSRGGPLHELVTALPHDARAGLSDHLAAAGLELPAVVTTDETVELMRDLTWVVARATGDGVPFAGGEVDPAIVHEGAEALDVDPQRVRAVFAAARTVRFVYVRSGRLITKKAVAAAVDQPATLWTMLAHALRRERLSNSRAARDLFLLALADGSAADPAIGLRRAAAAFALIDVSLGRRWLGDERPIVCDALCDCPRPRGVRWHDIVDAVIDDATRAATRDGSVALLRQNVDVREPDAPLAWMRDRTTTASPQFADDPADVSARDEENLLRAVPGLIHLLSVFGLARDVDGDWVVPPTLQQLARTALSPARSVRDDVHYGYGHDYRSDPF